MPIVYLLTSLFVLSQSAIFIRLANAHAAAIGFWRMAIALPVLGAILLWKRQHPHLARLSGSQWGWVILCAFFLFTHFYTWFLSVQMTNVANSMIIFSTNPLFTAIGAWIFFQEKIEKRHWVALAFCFGGIYFMVRDSLTMSEEHVWGDVMGLACSFLFSAYVLVGKGIRHRLPNLPFAFGTYSFVTFFFFALMLALGQPFFGYSPSTWIGFSGLAFGSTLLGHSMFTYCLQFFNVNLMSISTLSEPMLTALSAYLFFGEPITRGAIVGFVFVSVGIFALYFPYLRSLWGRKSPL